MEYGPGVVVLLLPLVPLTILVAAFSFPLLIVLLCHDLENLSQTEEMIVVVISKILSSLGSSLSSVPLPTSDLDCSLL